MNGKQRRNKMSSFKEIKVYQVKRTSREAFLWEGKKKEGYLLYEDYDLVAIVHLSKDASLEEAYRLTNSIHCAWWENSSVVKLFDGEGCRSTSRDDVLVDENDIAYAVLDFGLEPIDEETGRIKPNA